jgi:hypothetical protein
MISTLDHVLKSICPLKTDKETIIHCNILNNDKAFWNKFQVN